VVIFGFSLLGIGFNCTIKLYILQKKRKIVKKVEFFNKTNIKNLRKQTADEAVKSKTMCMHKKIFLNLIGVLLAAKAIFIILSWIITGTFIVTVNGMLIPMWLIDVGIIALILLALWAFKAAMCCNPEYWDKKKKKK